MDLCVGEEIQAAAEGDGEDKKEEDPKPKAGKSTRKKVTPSSLTDVCTCVYVHRMCDVCVCVYVHTCVYVCTYVCDSSTLC